MTEAATSITRRGFLGHAAGACAAAGLLSGSAMPGALDTLIARHRTAALRMVAAADLCDEHSTPARERASVEAVDAHEAAYEALLRFRPADLEETGRKVAYLAGRGGPWHGCLLDEWEVTLFVQSVLPDLA